MCVAQNLEAAFPTPRYDAHRVVKAQGSVCDRHRKGGEFGEGTYSIVVIDKLDNPRIAFNRDIHDRLERFWI